MSTRGSGLGVRAATVLSSPGWGLAAEAGDLSRAAAGFPPAMRQRSRPPGLSRPLRRAAIRKDSSDRGEPVMAAKSVKVTFVGARSEEHTSELQSLMRISYAVFCLKKKKTIDKKDKTVT